MLVLHAPAQSKDAVAITNHLADVVCATNEFSVADLQEAMGIKVLNFNVRLASPTNGVNVLIEIKKEGDPDQTVLKEMLDREKLNQMKAGTNFTVVLAINPVGSMDGVGIFEAKKLRVFWKLPGNTSGPGTIPNPFFKFNGGVANCFPYACRNAAGDFVLAEADSRDRSPKQHVELVVRFEQF